MSEVFKLLDDLEKAADRALREAGDMSEQITTMDNFQSYATPHNVELLVRMIRNMPDCISDSGACCSVMPDKCREKRLCSACAACYVKNSYIRACAHVSPSCMSAQPKLNEREVKITKDMANSADDDMSPLGL